MKDVLYLAWRYLRHNRGKTAVLVASIALILLVPAALQVIVRQGAERLTARADATPLLVGAPGSAVDLTLAALYFRPPTLGPTPYDRFEALVGTGLGTAIPLHLRYDARGQRIVGTTTDYLEFRGLELGTGRRFAVLGECVLGAEAARRLGARTGGAVLSSPAGAFDVGGSFPLEMSVVGVLEPTGTPDDEAVFVDLKTAWVIAGLAHGHDDVTAAGSEAGVLERQEDNVVANAAVLSYTRITPENIDSFHFHGDPAGFPVDAIVVVPKDRRSGTVLRGRYAEPGAEVQMVVPRAVVDDLVATLLSVRNLIFAVSLALSAATLATATLVFALSIRLRRRELQTMRRIGGQGQRVRAILAAEILIVVAAAGLIAAAFTMLVIGFGDNVLRALGA